MSESVENTALETSSFLFTEDRECILKIVDQHNTLISIMIDTIVT